MGGWAWPLFQIVLTLIVLTLIPSAMHFKMARNCSVRKDSCDQSTSPTVRSLCASWLYNLTSVCSHPDSTAEMGWQQKSHSGIDAQQLPWAVSWDPASRVIRNSLQTSHQLDFPATWDIHEVFIYLTADKAPGWWYTCWEVASSVWDHTSKEMDVAVNSWWSKTMWLNGLVHFVP